MFSCRLFARYDWDTHIHLLARGPGIKPGSTWVQPATQVDMAPTFLGLAARMLNTRGVSSFFF